MNYLDVYFSRINHLGETTAERIRNGGIRSFEKWKAESPHTVRNLSIERGLYFDGIILTNKDKEYQKVMFLNVANDIPLLIGDILVWPLEDGTDERWILLQEEKKVNGTYRTFWIVRCNYLIKWIDELGHLQSSWCYLVSSKDDKIKGNYRTWHNLISAQPNKYAEILMPRRVVNRDTVFIVEQEAWKVIEYDHTSVPGTVYLSLTEDKVNMIYDDTVNNIAELDRLAVYKLVAPPVVQHFNINDTIEPIFTIMKNGELFTPTHLTYFSNNPEIVKVVNNQLIGIGEGEATIKIKVDDNDGIEPEFLTLTIAVDNINTDIGYYIDGPDQIHLDREGNYVVRAQDGAIITINNALASLGKEYGKIVVNDISYTEDMKTCIVKANAKNLLDTCTLTINIEVDGQTVAVTKDIKIVPLW